MLTPASALDPGQITFFDDGGINLAGPSPTMELSAGDPDAIVPLVTPESNETLPVIGEPDSPLEDNSELLGSAPLGLNQVSRTADPQTPTQLSLLDEALGLMRSLAITEASPPNYTQHRLGAEVGEFHTPPT